MKIRCPPTRARGFLWIGYYSNIYDSARNLDRLALDEGASAGTGLFLQGVPSAPYFRLNYNVLVNQLRFSLAIPPTPTPEWDRVFDKGNIKTLKRNGGFHICHCALQCREYATCMGSFETCSRRPKAAVNGQ